MLSVCVFLKLNQTIKAAIHNNVSPNGYKNVLGNSPLVLFCLLYLFLFTHLHCIVWFLLLCEFTPSHRLINIHHPIRSKEARPDFIEGIDISFLCCCLCTTSVLLCCAVELSSCTYSFEIVFNQHLLSNQYVEFSSDHILTYWAAKLVGIVNYFMNTERF